MTGKKDVQENKQVVVGSFFLLTEIPFIGNNLLFQIFTYQVCEMVRKSFYNQSCFHILDVCL